MIKLQRLIFAVACVVTANCSPSMKENAQILLITSSPIDLNETIDINDLTSQRYFGLSSRERQYKRAANALVDGDASGALNEFKGSNFTEAELDIDINNGTDASFNETDFISEEEYLEHLRDFIFPKTWTWVLIFMHSIVFVIGIVGNILVCIAVYRNHSMRTVTNYFIVNLAVADFLVILFCLPPSVVWDVTLTWFFGTAMCKIVLYVQSVSVTVSVLTLTFISIDRWYAICFPLKFKSTTGRAKTAIGIFWIVALASDIPEAIYSTTVQPKLRVETIYLTQCAPTWSTDTDTIFVTSKMILFYVLPLFLMSIAYLQIIRVLWKSGNVPHQMLGGRQANNFAMNMNTSTEGQLRSRRKAAKMLVAVVVMFAICYFPVHLISVLRLTVGLTNSDTNRALSLISHWLCYANSAINPIIYNFMSGKFRIEFQRAFDHCCQTGDRHQSGFYSSVYQRNQEKDSLASRSQSRNDFEMRRLKKFDDSSIKHMRKGTKTSVLDI